MTPRRRRQTGIPGLSRHHVAVLEALINAREERMEAGLSPKAIRERGRAVFGTMSNPLFFQLLSHMLRRGWLVRMPVSHQLTFYFPTPLGEQIWASWSFLRRVAAARPGTMVVVARTTRPAGKRPTLPSWLTAAASSSEASSNGSRASR